MKVHIEFNCDNANFEEDFEGAVLAVLNQAHQKIVKQYRLARESESLKDINGNTVGSVRIDRD